VPSRNVTNSIYENIGHPEAEKPGFGRKWLTRLFLSRGGWALKDNLSLLLMTVPALAILFVFAYMPMPGIIIAFKDYSFGQGIFASDWVGLKNFEFLFSSGVASRILSNTLGYNALFIVTGLIASVGLALLLNEVRSRFLARIYQSSVFYPHFISWVVAGVFAFALLNSDGGLINKMLESFGIEPVAWYSNATPWPFILIIATLWKSAGYGSVIYLAAILSINPEYFEAAAMDGASRLQKIRYITLPLLVPMMTLMTLMAIGRIFYADFGLFFYIVRGGGEILRATDVIDTYVFRALLQSNDVGMASSAGFFQAIMGFALILITNTIIRRIDRERALF
jgi:putative aldouronate transport system permease protein